MYVTAGRSEKSKYDNRARVHIGIAPSHGDAPMSLCGQRPLAQVKGAPRIDITCSYCVDALTDLPELLDAGPQPHLLTIAS